MSLFRWIFSTVLAIALVIFSVFNMQLVEVTYSPVHAVINVPLAVIVTCALGLGFLSGGIFMWCECGPFSRKADKKRGQVYDLQREVKDLKEQDIIPPAVAPRVSMLRLK